MTEIDNLVETKLSGNTQNAMKMFTLSFVLLMRELMEDMYGSDYDINKNKFINKEKFFKNKNKGEKEEIPAPQPVNNIPPKSPDIEIPFPPSSEDPAYYIKLIADNWHISEKNTLYVLRALHTNHTGALLNLLLSVVARELDLSYEGHIKDSEYIYTFNPMDAKIYKQPTNGIKPVAFKYFAAFRTKEDAIFAIQMVSHIKNYIMRNTNE